MNNDDISKVQAKKFDMAEIGATGLEHFSGWLNEEKLLELRGERRNFIYREMEDNDPTIGGILFAIDKLIRQVQWRVEPYSQDPKDLEKADFLNSCRNDMEMPWTEVISEAMSMTTFGFAPLEMVFKRRQGIQPPQFDKPPEKRIPSSRFNDGYIGWKKLPLRAQETVKRWEITDQGEIEGLYQQAPPKFMEVFIPIDKLLLFRASTRKNNPEGKSAIRNAFRPWWFRKKIENIEGIGIERDLAGLPMAMVPPEILSQTAGPLEQEIRRKVERIVTNVRNDEQAGIVFPLMYDENGKQMYEFKLISTGGRRQFPTDIVIKRYRQDIAIVVIADFILLGHEKVGSFSLASSKTSIFTSALAAWVETVAEQFNRKAIPFLFMLNGFDLERLPQLTFGDIESIDLTELGAYVSSISGAGVDLTDEKAQNYLKSQANIPIGETEEK